MTTTEQKHPKILLLDIETAPNLAWVWGKYEQDVIEFENEWYMLSFAYKWSGQEDVTSVGLPHYSAFQDDPYDDSRLAQDLWRLLNEADIVIAHNGDAFDIPKINARFAYYGLVPPAPYKTVDTKKVAKKYFRFNSNSLTDLGKYLGLGEKVSTGGFKLWKDCMLGDKDAWAKMLEYNANDVTLLEKIYLALRPWMDNHPNMSLLSGQTEGCPNCASTAIQKRGTSVTRTMIKQRYQCQECGAWWSGALKTHEAVSTQ